MNPLMAGHAQTLQVFFAVGTTSGDGLLVMHQLCHHILPMLLTQLAERVTVDVSIPDLTPSFAVSLMLIVATDKVLVVLLHQFSMVFAVTTLVVGQFWAALVSTRPLRFHGHWGHLDFRHKKTSAGIAPFGGRYRFFFHDTILALWGRNSSEFYCTLYFSPRFFLQQ